MWVNVENNTIKRKKITYSPKKTVKKFKKANSVLKPETNSLSPSKRSKGTLELSHKNTKNKIHRKIKNNIEGKVNKFRWCKHNNTNKKQKSNISSAQINSNIDLILPIKLNIQFQK